MSSVTLVIGNLDIFPFDRIYIIMWSCPGNMPKYYPGMVLSR